jgi:hypothetical protein
VAGGWATAVGVLEEGVTVTLVSIGRVLEEKSVTFARQRCRGLLWHSCFVLYALHAGSRYGGGVFFGGETGGVNVDDVVRQGTLARGVWCGRLAHVLKYRISIPHTRRPRITHCAQGGKPKKDTVMAKDIQSMPLPAPTFKEALKDDKAQYDDCTPCRVVGELRSHSIVTVLLEASSLESRG